MPSKVERIKVEVIDSTEGETRIFNITMIVPTGDFQLSDLLQQRGVISALNAELKLAIKIATENYLSRSEALIATLKEESSTVPVARSNGKQQARIGRRRAPNAAASSELNKAVTAVQTDESRLAVHILQALMKGFARQHFVWIRYSTKRAWKRNEVLCT